MNVAAKLNETETVYAAKPVLITEKDFMLINLVAAHVFPSGEGGARELFCFSVVSFISVALCVKQFVDSFVLALLCWPLFTGQQYHLSSISIFQISL